MNAFPSAAQLAAERSCRDVRTGSRRRPPFAFELVVALAFSLLLIVQIARHAMWEDELNAWGLVLASPTLADLFANLHYEGHPGLWHLLLWLASGISTAPATMQVVHGAIGILLILWIALVAPFSRVAKVLLLGSYFVVFEYTVISRNYGIGMLLALVYAERRSRHPEQRKRNAGLLGLLANTNMFGLILTAALALEYLLHDLAASSDGFARRCRRLAPAASIYLALLLLAVATLAPAPDISWRTTGHPFSHGLSPTWLLLAVTVNVSSLLDPAIYWGLGDQSARAATERVAALIVILPLIPALVLGAARAVRRAPSLAVIPAVTFAGTVAFNVLFYFGSVRHWGINFVALVATLWIHRDPALNRAPWVLLILGLNAASGLFITVQLWNRPFSEAGAAARWLTAHHLQDAVLVGTPDTNVAPIAELLRRPMVFLDCSCTDSFLRYSNRRDGFDASQLPQRLAAAVQQTTKRPIILLTTYLVPASQQAALGGLHLELTELARFDGAVVNENYVAYEVTGAGCPTQPTASAAPAAC